ncbi:MAG: hypothetical protein AAB679_00340 [Patescibacteria group bacterium]
MNEVNIFSLSRPFINLLRTGKKRYKKNRILMTKKKHKKGGMMIFIFAPLIKNQSYG